MKPQQIKNRTIRLETSYRGGGIEIHLDGLKRNKYKGVKMTAYQNYLGGDMMGAIGNSCNLRGWRDDSYLVEIAEELARYYHGLTHDEWDTSFEEYQVRPISAY